MSQTDKHPEQIRPGAGLRRLRRGDLSSSPESTSTVLSRTQFHAMIRAEIDRASEAGNTVLLARAAIRPIPGSGIDLRGRQLPRELVARLADAHEHTRVAALDGSHLMLAVPALQNRAEAEQIVAKLLEALTVPVVVDGLPHHLGPRLGAAVVDDDNTTIEALQEGSQLALEETDAANPTMLFHPFQRVRNNLRVDLSSDLRAAVVEGDIEAAVQPVFEFGSMRPVAYQAFARWNRPDHGQVPAAEFTDLAITLGVEHVLQWQVLHKALALIPNPPPSDTVERDAGTDPLTMWFTVSAHQVLHPQFTAMIADAASVHDRIGMGLDLKPCPPAEAEDVYKILRGLIDEGVRVAAGDFGLGNANLTSLRSLGFDSVKLDRSLTSTVSTSGKAESIVGALIKIATELGVETTGRGIETADQLDTLQRLGCQLGQGFHLAEPIVQASDQLHPA
jgi:EAL domain-containing protein (putative c-di-GMP-specific phosphodiesterase class I)